MQSKSSSRQPQSTTTDGFQYQNDFQKQINTYFYHFQISQFHALEDTMKMKTGEHFILEMRMKHVYHSIYS